MAVFTQVDNAAFERWARRRYALQGECALTPIAEGIENTNYHVRFQSDGAAPTELRDSAAADGGAQEFVFTVFELWDAAAVDYYTALMRHFCAAGLSVPAPRTGANGAARQEWDGKPCVLVPFAPGAPRLQPAAAHCRQIGDWLARAHIAAASFLPRRPNPRGAAWRQDTAARIRPALTPAQRDLLDDALTQDAAFCAAPLPMAACHCDLFRNNVLWHGGAGAPISAVIDFYFGGDDALLFDLAVCACDWCFDSAHGERFCQERLAALLDGYHARRRLCALERARFADALGSAALRFWISRQYDMQFPREAQRLTAHDPDAFERIVRAARDERAALTALLRAAA